MIKIPKSKKLKQKVVKKRFLYARTCIVIARLTIINIINY